MTRRHRLAPLLVAALVAAGCSSTQPGRAGFRPVGTAGGLRVEVPAGWARVAHPPRSVGLVLLVEGRSDHAGCPGPLLLVRQTGRPTGTLAQAVVLYDRLEEIRRPDRVVVSQRSVSIPGTTEAELIVSRFPAGEDTGSSDTGPTVQAFDLLALTTGGQAVHVFASGCAADLPAGFLHDAVLSLRGG